MASFDGHGPDDSTNVDGADGVPMSLSEICTSEDSATDSIKDERSINGMSSSDINEGSTARNRGTSPAIKRMTDKGILIHGLQKLFHEIDDRENYE